MVWAPPLFAVVGSIVDVRWVTNQESTAYISVLPEFHGPFAL